MPTKHAWRLVKGGTSRLPASSRMIAYTATTMGILDTNRKAHVMEHWKLPLEYDHGVNLA